MVSLISPISISIPNILLAISPVLSSPLPAIFPVSLTPTAPLPVVGFAYPEPALVQNPLPLSKE